ncbi:MAG: universal stress protein [Candidatus Eremiobacteraeota bacterium]|jgi:nucleotide-binding universal stress UspA family protein|nr:universal stress protein [Candidatus Eremiobacteraeota bacterium]
MSFTHPFARIVVGYDGSPPADAALARAVALAEQFAGDVVIAHVSDIGAPTVLPLDTKARRERRETEPVVRGLDVFRRGLLRQAAERVASCSVPVSLDLSTNGVVAGVLNAAQRWNATAIAVGTRGLSGLAGLLVGSYADGLLRIAHIPVIVVSEGMSSRAPELHRIVVGVDASPPSEGAAVFAVALSLHRNVRLVFCTVVEAHDGVVGAYGYDPIPYLHEIRPSARDALDAGLQYANAVDVYPDTEIVDAHAAATGLLEASRRQRADAIVVGTHGRRHLDRVLLGSTAEALVRSSDVPVIVVPARTHLLPGVLAETASG